MLQIMKHKSIIKTVKGTAHRAQPGKDKVMVIYVKHQPRIYDYDLLREYLCYKATEVDILEALEVGTQGETFFDDFEDFLKMKEREKAHKLGVTDEEMKERW